MTVGALNSNLVFLCNKTMPKNDIYHGKLEITEIVYKEKKKRGRQRYLKDIQRYHFWRGLILMKTNFKPSKNSSVYS